ncbi:MAG: non-ribosomal peptide synthetase [Bacteroidota bacterium]
MESISTQGSSDQFGLDALNSAGAKLVLPADFLPSPQVGERFQKKEFHLSSKSSARIQQLATLEKSSLPGILLTAYRIFLAKWTQSTDILLGIHVGQDGKQTEAMPFASHLTPSQSARDCLQLMEAALAFDRDHLTSPTAETALAFPASFCWNPSAEFISDNADLCLAAWPGKRECELTFWYDTQRFSSATVERFVGYYQQIVLQLTDDLDLAIHEMEILSSEERQQLLFAFNDTERDFSRDKTILDVFDTHVAQQADKVAVICGDQRLTYGELNQQANQLANFLLQSHRIQADDAIALHLERRAEMIVAILAVLKTGAAYLPIDLKNTPERIRKIVADAKPCLLLTDQVEKLEGVDLVTEILDWRTEKNTIDQCPSHKPVHQPKGSDAAYIVYTSGSTGTPKGILIEHSALLDYSQTFAEYFGVDAEQRMIQQASLGFDMSMEEIFPPLWSGASFVIIPEGGLDVPSIIDAVRDKGATILTATPLVANELNRFADQLTNLKAVICGGEAMQSSHVDRLAKTAQIYNHYGPSESTVCITFHTVRRLEEASLIGQPIANRQVYILDEKDALCPLLVPGELCVSGVGLAREYLNNPSMTAAKFVDNPFHPGRRMYKTGDRARWLPDGRIEFLGRMDKQVKIRGIRIELGEIESRLSRFSGIAESAVVTRDRQGDKCLVGYYVADREIEASRLTNFLSADLPDYMLPNCFVRLDKLPQTTSGKLDHKALPEPQIQLATDYVSPTTEVEKQLTEIWAKVLGLREDTISIDASFFELGGHSIKVVASIGIIYERMNVDVKRLDFFRLKTIRRLAEHIENEQWLQSNVASESELEDEFIID